MKLDKKDLFDRIKKNINDPFHINFMYKSQDNNPITVLDTNENED